MSSISSRRLSRSSLIFFPFLATSGLAPPPSSPSLGLLGLTSFFFCSAMTTHLLAPPCSGPAPGLDRREDDPLLALVLPLPIRIGRLAGLVRFEEEDLGDPFVGVNLGRQRRGVADLERHVSL